MELPSLIVGEPAAKSGNPHRAIRIDKQVLHRAAFETCVRPGSESRKSDSVEAEETSAGGQPEIPVRSLLDPANGCDAGVARPGSVSILRDAISRVQGQCRKREYSSANKCAASSPGEVY